MVGQDVQAFRSLCICNDSARTKSFKIVGCLDMDISHYKYQYEVSSHGLVLFISTMLIYYVCSLDESPVEPTAKIINTFLRVVSPNMLQEYGSDYMNLLRSIQQTILPILGTKNVLFDASLHKKQLEDFLNSAVSSNGRDFLELII